MYYIKKKSSGKKSGSKMEKIKMSKIRTYGDPPGKTLKRAYKHGKTELRDNSKRRVDLNMGFKHLNLRYQTAGNWGSCKTPRLTDCVAAEVIN